MVEDCDEPLREKGLDFQVCGASVEIHLFAVPVTQCDIFVCETVSFERLAHPPSCVSITMNH